MPILPIARIALAFVLISSTSFSFEGERLPDSSQSPSSPEVAQEQPKSSIPLTDPLEVKLLNLDLQANAEEEQYGAISASTEKAITQVRSDLCDQGMLWYCPDVELEAQNVDIDALAYAVAMAETSNCTTGTALSKNNCFGITICKEGKCRMKAYARQEDSFQDFKRLWLKNYGDRFPTLKDAARYSDGPGDSWLQRVTAAYNHKLRTKEVTLK